MRALMRVYAALSLLALASLACSVGGVFGPVQPSATPSDTPTVTLTLSPTITATPVIAPTRVVSPTPVRTATPTHTPSFTPAPSATPSFTPTDTPAAGATLPAAGGVTCPMPAGGFALIYNSDPALAAAIGCPTSQQPNLPPQAWVVQTAYQSFERGFMVWSSRLGWVEQRVIYVLFNDGSYRRFDDAWQEGVDPERGGESPPEGLLEPARGFGKVWRDNPEVRAGLGWALGPEAGAEGRIQLFAGGEMFHVPQAGLTYIFIQGPPGRWQPNPTPY